MPFARQLYAHALPCLLSMTLWSTATIGLPALAQGQRLSLEFSQASLHDPEYQSAIAQRDGGVESLEQAKAALLPQISSNLQRSQNNTDSRSQTLLGPVDRSFDIGIDGMIDDRVSMWCLVRMHPNLNAQNH